MDALYNWNDGTKIGVALCGLGGLFTFFGVIMFLDSALLTMGNLLFVAGVAMVMGPQRCKAHFLERSRLKATTCFVIGVLLVMRGHCFFGFGFEFFGWLNLFGNFFPMVARVLESIPVIGPLMRLPAVRFVLDRFDVGPRRNV